MSIRAKLVVSLSAVLAWLPAAGAEPQEAVPLNKAYVSNNGDGTITVVDLDTMTAVGSPLNVGNGPRGGAVAPDQGRVYIVNQQANDLMVIDTATDSLVTRTPVGGRPFRCGISPDGTGVYAACHTTHDVWLLKTADDTAAQVFLAAGGGVQDAKVSPDGTRVLASNNLIANADFFGTADDKIIGSDVPVGVKPNCVAYSEDGATAIVLGVNDTTFVDVATGAVLATVPGEGEHEEVRVVGDLAYSTNLAYTPAVEVVADGTLKSDALPGATAIDVFDMKAHTLLRSIAIGGDGANGIDVSLDGRTAWIAMRLTDELREMDLVTETETGRVVPVGSAPRCVTAVFRPNPIPTYFLPRSMSVKIPAKSGERKGAAFPKDVFTASGFYDDGGATVDYAQPVTVTIGGYARTVTLVPNSKKTTYKFKDGTLTFTALPNFRKSSLGKFTMKVVKTSLAGIIDTSEPVQMSFAASGMQDAAGEISLTKGAYRLGKKPGDILLPQFFPAHLTSKIGGAGKDQVYFKGGFASGGVAPTRLGTVRVAIGPNFSRTISGGLFTKAATGNAWSYKASVGKSKITVKIDFLRETVAITATNTTLGALGATTDIVIDAGNGRGVFRNTVRLGQNAKGTARTY